MDFLERLERYLINNNQNFLLSILKENKSNIIQEKSKYDKIIKWIDSQLYFQTDIINNFNPSIKDKDYTNEYFNQYCDACKNIAILVNAKNIMLSENCTTEIRDNWIYCLCKVFNIKYNEKLEMYV